MLYSSGFLLRFKKIANPDYNLKQEMIIMIIIDVSIHEESWIRKHTVYIVDNVTVIAYDVMATLFKNYNLQNKFSQNLRNST